MNKTYKAYEENGQKYIFDSKKFLECANRMKYDSRNEGIKITKMAIMSQLSDRMYVSIDAVKNWMYGYNGPSELEQVKSLGAFLSIDYHQLLKKEEVQMVTITDEPKTIGEEQTVYTKNCLREIYHKMIKFIDECKEDFYSLEGDEDTVHGEEYKDRAAEARTILTTYYDDIVSSWRKSLLDIPGDMYEKIGVTLDMYYDFIDCITDTDYSGQLDDYLLYYFEKGFEEEMKELFEDYLI